MILMRNIANIAVPNMVNNCHSMNIISLKKEGMK